MLIPPFAGVGLKAFDKAGTDITGEVFAPNGLMKVDADYQPKPYEDWSKHDWPKTYRTPKYQNVFAIGIAFAPLDGLNTDDVLAKADTALYRSKTGGRGRFSFFNEAGAA